VPLVTLLTVLPLSACGGDADADPTPDPTVAATAADAGERPAFGIVTPEQAATLATDPAITVLDVRTPEEFTEGHLAGAVLVDFSSPAFADEVAQLDPSQPYLVYCRSGNRSGQAVAAMQQAGFAQLWDMDGGVTAWTAAGLPIEA
jgi:phage shock protein E